MNESLSSIQLWTCLLFAASAVLLLTGAVWTLVVMLRRKVANLEQQNTEYARELYRRDRKTEDVVTKHPALPSGQPVEQDSSDDSESVNFAMLLLALQDIGRRVSMNLDMGTLIPTIISSAKASLKCGECSVYFWNPRKKTLSPALPPRSREQSNYIPSPQRGMTAWVIERRQILTRKAIEDDYNLRELLEAENNLPDAIAPLAVGGELLGLLVVDKAEQDAATFVRLLYILANTYALGIKNAQLFSRIEEMARRDGLTGLLNHAHFQQELQTLADRAATKDAPLTVIMGDVDHFKKFNDTWGHQAGDHVLREVARLWQAVLPDHAVLARYGGEEFICALPGDDLSRGTELAELMRAQMESHPMDFDGEALQVTSSFGVAELGRPAQSTKDLIRLADEALYSAKESGRNRVTGSARSLTVIASRKDT